MKHRALLLLCCSCVTFLGCSANNSQTPPMVGGDKDAHGCIASAGYAWCANKQQCVRPWELPPIAHEGPTTKERFIAHCGQ